MLKVFISHSVRDVVFATALSHYLKELGVTPWQFGQNVSPGQKWEDEISRQLRDADALVVIVSSESAKSSWVNHEIGMALAYSEEKGTPLILPVMLGDVKLEAPLGRYLGIQADSGDPQSAAIDIATTLERNAVRTKVIAERREAAQKKVEVSAADFIQKSLIELQERETSYRRLAYIWYGIAYSTLVASAGFGVWRALVLHPTSLQWPALVELAISGIIVLALLVALAKYAFTLGKSFMVEALRNADRRHAISFGEFYLQAFGADGQWQDVKDAFQNWNIDKGSHFLGQSHTEFDPQVLSIAIELAKAFGRHSSDRKA